MPKRENYRILMKNLSQHIRFATALLVAAIVLCVAVPASAAVGYRLGDTAPTFTLPSLDGREHSLEELRSNGHVMLVFWAVECVYCYAHIGDFNRLHEQYQGKGLTVAAINVSGEYPKEVEDYATSNGLKYLVLSDRLKNLDVVEAYNVVGTPTIVVVAPSGDIVWRGHTVPDVTKWIKTQP